MTAHRLALAARLLAAGAGCSARRVLGSVRGGEANRLRVACRTACLSPGVHAVGVTLDGLGLVVPLAAQLGQHGARESDFGKAVSEALAATRRCLALPQLPSLRLDLEEWLPRFGSSVGLPAFLAFVDHAVTPAQRRPIPILATGALTSSSAIGSVEEAYTKVAAALEELGEADGLVLLPAGNALDAGIRTSDPRVRLVASLDDAINQVFLGGASSLIPDPGLIALDQLILRVRAETDEQRALQLLEAVVVTELAPADRARVLLERGTRHRHLGHTATAAALHAQAIAALDSERGVVGAEASERFELEQWSTRMDQFELQESIVGLGERLERPFLVLRNEVRCRGMLAQALGMAGRFTEAVETRRKNLGLQQQEEWLRRVLPGTYCCLALDSARGGDATAFEQHATELVRHTSLGDPHQWRYSGAALARGLVALGRHEAALAFASGRERCAGATAPEGLRALTQLAGAPVGTHPEVSVIRALCRALRATGRPADAVILAARVPLDPTPSDLVAWLRQLPHLEAALALLDLGQPDEAEARIRDARRNLDLCHPQATKAHPSLASGPLDALATGIDLVWY